MRGEGDDGLWAEAELAATRVGQVKPDAARRAAATPPPVGGAGAAAARRPAPAAKNLPQGDAHVPPEAVPAALAALTGRRRGGSIPGLTTNPTGEPAPWGRRVVAGTLVLALALAGALALSPELRALTGALAAGLLSQPGPLRPPADGAATGTEAADPGARGAEAAEPGAGAGVAARPGHEVVTVVAAGDLLLAGGLAAQFGRPGDVLYPLGAVAPILRAADLAVVNLVGAPPQAAALLAAAGVGTVHLPGGQTNAAPDRRELQDSLRAAGIDSFGAGADPALLPTLRGTRLALVGFSDPGAPVAGPGQVTAASPTVDALAALARVRQEADFVLVLANWGPPGQPAPDARQRQLARLLVEAGADMILGARPGVRQTVEWIEGRPVLYSLGRLAAPGGGEGALVLLRLYRGRLLALEQVPLRLDGEGVPALAAPGPGGIWVELSGDMLLRWRGDPAAERHDLWRMDRLPAAVTCPAGRYRVVAAAAAGIRLAHEGLAGSQYWLAPDGCAAVPADLLPGLAQELAPGAQVVVPAGGL